MIKRFKTTLGVFFNYMRVVPQLVRGAWILTGLSQPIVSVFGGSRVNKRDAYYEMSKEASSYLAKQGISILTGGGPGIMEAANCGALEIDDGHMHTMGIGVSDLKGEQINACAQRNIVTDYFLVRKYLLIYFSQGFLVFPGGFGTIDELAELLTLMQTDKVKIAPVVLMGKDYWYEFFDWVEVALGEGLIPKEHAKLITITDSLDEACSLLASHCDATKKS
jgi:uncharacterized protein (TIGR00730 family)